MSRHYISFLVLHGRPRRLPRKLTDADRTTLRQFAHQLAALRREVATVQRTDQARRDDMLIVSSLLAQIGLVQQSYRDVVAVVHGIRSREVVGLIAEDKNVLIKIVNQIAEEYKDVGALRSAVAALVIEVEQHRGRLTRVERRRSRAVGGDAS